MTRYNNHDITGVIDSLIDGSHPYFSQRKYDSFTSYKIIFTETTIIKGFYDINIYIVDDNHKGGGVNLLLLNRYLNTSALIILDLVKTYQHNGNWDGDMFVIQGDIKRNK